MRNTILFAAISVAVLAALITMVVLHQKDRGLIQAECNGAKVGMRWGEFEYPLRIRTKALYAEDTLAAAEFWNEKLGAEVFIVFYRWATPPKTHISVDLIPMEDEHGSAKLRWSADCRLAEVEITAPMDSQASLRRVLMHELGHALGLGHDDQSKSVMHPRYAWVGTHLSDKDVALIRGVMGL